MHWRKVRNRDIVEVNHITESGILKDIKLADIELDLPNFHIPFCVKTSSKLIYPDLENDVEVHIFNVLVNREERIFIRSKNKEVYLFSFLEEQIMVNENLGTTTDPELSQRVIQAIVTGIKSYGEYFDRYYRVKLREQQRIIEQLGMPSFTFDTAEDHEKLMNRDYDGYMLKAQYMPFTLFSVTRPFKYPIGNDDYLICPRVDRISKLPDNGDEVKNLLIDYEVYDLFEDISYSSYKNGALFILENDTLGSKGLRVILLNERFSNGIVRPSPNPRNDQKTISEAADFCKKFTDILSMGRRGEASNTKRVSSNMKTSKSVNETEDPTKDDSKEETLKSVIYIKEYEKSVKTKYSRGSSRSRTKKNDNAFHLVRGHMRYYKSGKSVFIKSFKRGNAKRDGSTTSKQEYVIKF